MPRDPSPYSPRLRTALVLTGTGTAGAYHAGVLRALHESSVRFDLVAGDGVGAIGALFAALDGAAALWESDGPWRPPQVRHFYKRTRGWRLRRLWNRSGGRSDPRRRARERVWRRVTGPPLDCDKTTGRLVARLWTLVSSGAGSRGGSDGELGARAAELLLENLGQPGFRELVLTVHDLDAQRDLVFGLLAEARRRDFFQPRDHDPASRSAEAFDLAGGLRDRAIDVLTAALRVPLVTDPHVITFPVESAWRGESHYVVQRVGSLVRLVEEVVRTGAEQLIIASASPEPIGPHNLRAARTDRLGRFGDCLMSAEAAALRDVQAKAARLRVFIVRPHHNPLGPFDFAGAYDPRSDRRHALDELMQRGYEDAVRRVIDPVVTLRADEVAGR
ncbi:MAG: patatin-like phospholipase family protein [Acidobacteria bacterium]|nr:patatin-like phospholipase family protein [Acidobacteriota bacterium]MBI3262796.1 patatin-like phospholipase family protein [Acidobacteriota bacterium]